MSLTPTLPAAKPVAFNPFAGVEDTFNPIKLLFISEAGGGKTFKSAFFVPPGKKIAFFNFDKNLSCLQGLPKEIRAQVIVINPYLNKEGKEYPIQKFFTNFMELMALALDNDEIGTVVVDSLTTLAHGVQWQLLGKIDPMAKPSGYDYWSYFGNHWKYFANQVLQNPELDKHIIVIAHDEVDIDKVTGTKRRQLLLDGGMKHEFGLLFSDIWRCLPRVPTSGPIEWMVRTGPTSDFSCKCSDSSVSPDINFDKLEDRKKLTSMFKPYVART